MIKANPETMEVEMIRRKSNSQCLGFLWPAPIDDVFDLWDKEFEILKITHEGRTLYDVSFENAVAKIR